MKTTENIHQQNTGSVMVHVQDNRSTIIYRSIIHFQEIVTIDGHCRLYAQWIQVESRPSPSTRNAAQWLCRWRGFFNEGEEKEDDVTCRETITNKTLAEW